MNKAKIQYINLTPINARRAKQQPPVPVISLVSFALRSFYKKVGKHYDKYEWLDSIYSWWEPSVNSYTNKDIPWEVDNALNEIKEKKPDIVCITVYVWNFDSSMYLAKLIKEFNPNTTIIVGGPSIDHKSNEKFMSDNPYIDYVIYSDGEEAFQILLDSFIEPIDERTIPNLITKDFKTPFKLFRFKDFEPFNPYLDMQDEFIKEYNKALAIREQIYPEKDNDPTVRPHINSLIDVVYERIRGCPYTCTFCDWNSGLHTKVNKSLADWRAEIKFLSQFRYICFEWIDANIGMTKEDVDIMRFAFDHFNGIDQAVRGHNMAKQNKERVLEIEKMREDSLETKVSLQHIDDLVLENIQRPSVTWEKHKEMMADLIDNHGKSIKVELINGLPGATHEKNMHQLHELIRAGVNTIILYPWELLPNTPAYEKDYQEKHQLKSMLVYFPHEDLHTTHEEFYKKYIEKDVASGLRKAVVQYQNSLEDYILYQLSVELFNVLSFPNSILYFKHDAVHAQNREDRLEQRLKTFNKCLTKMTPLFKMIAKQQEHTIIKQLSEYGFVLWGFPVGDTIVPWDEAVEKLCSNAMRNILENPNENELEPVLDI